MVLLTLKTIVARDVLSFQHALPSIRAQVGNSEQCALATQALL
jgi:hypothetical protein